MTSADLYSGRDLNIVTSSFYLREIPEVLCSLRGGHQQEERHEYQRVHVCCGGVGG